MEGFANEPTAVRDHNAVRQAGHRPTYSQQPDYPALSAVDLRWNSPALLTDSFPSNISLRQIAVRAGDERLPDPTISPHLGRHLAMMPRSPAPPYRRLTTAIDRPGGDGPTAATLPEQPGTRTLLQTCVSHSRGFHRGQPRPRPEPHHVAPGWSSAARGGTSNRDIVTAAGHDVRLPGHGALAGAAIASTPGSGPDDTPYAVSALSVAIIVILVAIALRSRRQRRGVSP